MKSENLKAMEREAAAEIIARVRQAADTQAETMRGGAGKAAGWSKARIEQAIELRYALIAVVEASIGDGLDPVLALMLTRDTGMAIWAVKHLVQHGGKACLGCAASELQTVSSDYLAILGIKDVPVQADAQERSESAHSPTRH